MMEAGGRKDLRLRADELLEQLDAADEGERAERERTERAAAVARSAGLSAELEAERDRPYVGGAQSPDGDGSGDGEQDAGMGEVDAIQPSQRGQPAPNLLARSLDSRGLHLHRNR